MYRATSPHSIFIGLRDGDPPISSWTGRSRSERESKAQLAVGPTGGDQLQQLAPRQSSWWTRLTRLWRCQCSSRTVETDTRDVPFSAAASPLPFVRQRRDDAGKAPSNGEAEKRGAGIGEEIHLVPNLLSDMLTIRGALHGSKLRAKVGACARRCFCFRPKTKPSRPEQSTVRLGTAMQQVISSLFVFRKDWGYTLQLRVLAVLLTHLGCRLLLLLVSLLYY